MGVGMPSAPPAKGRLGLLTIAAIYASAMLIAAMGLWAYDHWKPEAEPQFQPVSLVLSAITMRVTPGERLPLEASVCNRSDQPMTLTLFTRWHGGEDETVLGPVLALTIAPGCHPVTTELPVSQTLAPGSWELVALIIVDDGDRTQTLTRVIGPIHMQSAEGAGGQRN